MTIATDLVTAALATAIEEKGSDYLLRTAGSRVPSLTTGEASVAFLSDLPFFVDVTEEAVALGVAFGRCRYMRALVPLRVGAVEAIALLDDLDDAELSGVRVVRGRHGLELVAGHLPMRPTTEIHVIVGHPDDPTIPPTVGSAMMYTWYPGRLTQAVALAKATVKLG